ncbi:MAG: hypothetical protein WC694_01550 [Candidatus Paceibacterota bacterium]|jgi:hypothetical protein
MEKTNYLRRIIINVGIIPVAVYDMGKKGTLAQIFKSLGEANKICFSSKDMVDDFCREHSDKLSHHGSTFFLVRKGGGYIVVRIRVNDDNHPHFVEYGLEHFYVWSARHRVVVVKLPQKKKQKKISKLFKNRSAYFVS